MKGADAIVIGGGPAGLASALFLARRGAEVALVEPEPGPPAGDADGDFRRWRRRAVPQAQHSHLCLGLGGRVLAEEAPDVVSAMRERGVQQVPATFLGLGAIDGASRLLARRLVFEGVLHRAVAQEPGVEMVGDSVAVFVSNAGSAPRVTGVVTGSGREIAAPVVIDATGRRSAVRERVAPLGVPDLPVDVHPIGLQYYTRFYRLHDDVDYPSTNTPITARLPYLSAMAFPSDNRTYSLTIACFVDDPHRRALADADTFERVHAEVPLTSPWVGAGEPISPLNAMARIENRWQRLVDDSGTPLVEGLVLVGDSAMHTNPTFGRGMSLAFEQAQQLAMRLSKGNGNAADVTAEFEEWIRERQAPWFHLQVAADTAMVERFRAGTRGEVYRPPQDRDGWMQLALPSAALHDEVAAGAMSTFLHMLRTPAEIFGDADLVQRLESYVAEHGLAPPPVAGPSRSEFEAMVAA